MNLGAAFLLVMSTSVSAGSVSAATSTSAVPSLRLVRLEAVWKLLLERPPDRIPAPD
jgi:hypothetical protein